MNENLSMKERILIAAKEEFGKKGYLQASTNNIHTKAGVSKGLVFKVFGSKANLFYELFRDSLDKMIKAMDKENLDQEKDIIKKITDIAAWKIAYASEHKDDINIMLEALSNTPPELKDKMANHIQDLFAFNMDRYFEEIDMTDIDERYTKEDVKKYLTIATQGIQQIYLNRILTMDDFDEIREEIMELFYILMKGMKNK